MVDFLTISLDFGIDLHFNVKRIFFVLFRERKLKVDKRKMKHKASDVLMNVK